MNRADQLEWEARWGRPAAAAAFGSALLLLAGFVTREVSRRSTTAEGDSELLGEIESHLPQVITITVLNALAVALLIGALIYLFETTKPRLPETPPAARILAIVGPILYTVLLVAILVLQVGVAREFASLPAGFRTDEIGEGLLKDSALSTVQLMGLGVSLAFGFAFVLISLSAMRAGLLSRFMGILGIIVGVLYVVPLLGDGPPVSIFWLGALAVLFLDRWPGGRGPAWASGEAIAWPSAMETAKAREDGVQQERAKPQEPAAAKPRRKRRR